MPKPVEQRTFSHSIEVRETPDGSINLRGYAAVFDAPAYGEVVTRSAFNRTIAQGDTVRLLVNHDGIPLASTKSGTLHLSVDEVGLVAEAKGLDPANPTVQELRSAMSRGDIDQMSFAFQALDDPIVDGVRELREVKLHDVSVVTHPWYDSTSVELNSLDRALVKMRSRAPLEQDERDLIIIALKGDVEIEDSTVTDSSTDSSTETEDETESEPVTAQKSMTLTEARALLGLEPAA